jgi:predicted short-subunit dehydrogenase-like oxidoreductase (DUF2520 family)
MQSVYLIGAGRLATQLGLGFKKAGVTIAGVYSKKEPHARELAEKLDCSFTIGLNSIPVSADVYIIALKDDVLYEELSLGHLKGRIIAHTSGSVEASVLEKYSQNYGVFYPLFTFTKEKPAPWADIPLCLEASDANTKKVLGSLAEKLGSKVFDIDSKQRAILHYAAVWVNNFTNQLLYIAEESCKAENIPFEILRPIALETINKAFANSPYLSQTGPALRSDRKTIEKHLRIIGNDEDRTALYILLSKAIRQAHAKEN